jgi:hypothetical protein
LLVNSGKNSKIRKSMRIWTAKTSWGTRPSSMKDL